MEIEVRKQVMDLIRDKLVRLAVDEDEIGNSFDLVKSGLLNSLEFVDLVASLEKLNKVEIDFEEALILGDFTTISGLIRSFSTKK
jgi:acyl carrier protein